jgi:hypothetical protein
MLDFMYRGKILQPSANLITTNMQVSPNLAWLAFGENYRLSGLTT